MNPNPLETLCVLHFDDVQRPLIDTFLDECRHVSITPLVESKPNSPYNALEDYIPTAIALFVAKPFLEAFLKRAGEDAYAGFKKAVSSLLAKAAAVKVKVIATAPGKFDPNYPYSRYISIYSKTPNGATLKFIFLTSRDSDYYTLATESLCELIRNESYPPPSRGPLGNIYVLYFDETEKQWKYKNPKIG